MKKKPVSPLLFFKDVQQVVHVFYSICRKQVKFALQHRFGLEESISIALVEDIDVICIYRIVKMASSMSEHGGGGPASHTCVNIQQSVHSSVLFFLAALERP